MLSLSRNSEEVKTQEPSNIFNNLDDQEKTILELLKGGERMSLDDIQTSLKVSSSQITPAITMLEIKGLLSKRTDGKFEFNL